MKTISIRKQMVQNLLLAGKKPKDIAIAAHCTVQYVYSIKCEMNKIAKSYDIQHNEKTPPLWKIILGGIGGLVFIFFVIILALSL